MTIHIDALSEFAWCGNCAACFAKADGDFLCRRHAPRPLTYKQKSEFGYASTYWPEVDEFYWCAEWLPHRSLNGTPKSHDQVCDGEGGSL